MVIGLKKGTWQFETNRRSLLDTMKQIGINGRAQGFDIDHQNRNSIAATNEFADRD
jgi:hypothetical protein